MDNRGIRHRNHNRQFTSESVVPPAPKSVPKITKDIKTIEVNKSNLNRVSELICLKCLRRWIDAYPESSLLKDIKCQCGLTGYVIKTGQEYLR